MNQESLYWLFSTTSQTLGAIVGLIGMLAVYRLDQLTDKKPKDAVSSIEDILAGPPQYLGKSLDPGLIKKRWLEARNTAANVITGDPAARLNAFLATLEKIDRVSAGTRDRFIHFIAVNLFTILYSLICLLFTEAIWGSRSRWLWLVLLGILVVFSLAATVRLCMAFTETSLKDYLNRLWINIKEHVTKWTSPLRR